MRAKSLYRILAVLLTVVIVAVFFIPRDILREWEIPILLLVVFPLSFLATWATLEDYWEWKKKKEG